jgi:hypothetical protein
MGPGNYFFANALSQAMKTAVTAANTVNYQRRSLVGQGWDRGETNWDKNRCTGPIDWLEFGLFDMVSTI